MKRELELSAKDLDRYVKWALTQEGYAVKHNVPIEWEEHDIGEPTAYIELKEEN